MSLYDKSPPSSWLDIARNEARSQPQHPTIRDGAQFILDENADLEARWGYGSEVLWARGESVVIAGPAGVGKTTLAGQIVGGLIGVLPNVLGYPITPASRVLYLAMDRPRQVRRALRRIFGEEHRQALTERLAVRPGPIPQDLGKNPDTLLDLAYAHNCDVIIIDSLKDAAVKLSDDETGGNVNRAIQACNAADIDVCALHHQRKGQGGEKPTKLEDVYGSTWITAGSGSVFLLWGEAGSEIVELTHLKQPADPLGPWTLEHDHHRGTTTISRGFDALAYLRLQLPGGATVTEAATAEHGTGVAPGSAKWKRTERRLRRLVNDGLATTGGQTNGSGGQFQAVTYYAVAVDFTVDTHRGHTPKTGSAVPPWTTVDTNGETPGHTVDATVDNRGHAHRGHSPGGLLPPECHETKPTTPQPDPLEDF